METQLLTAHNVQRDAENIRAAAMSLLEGQVIAFPTETVYGLGARADSQEAVELLKRIKGRPEGKPFAILVPSVNEAGRLVGRISERFERLAARFWPGPLTIVVPDGKGGTIGMRCPAHPVALELLRVAGVGISAPSANRSGKEPAKRAQEIYDEFAGEIAVVLDGGPSQIGQASTVVRLWDEGYSNIEKARNPAGEGWEIVRQGVVTADEIRAIIGSG